MSLREKALQRTRANAANAANAAPENTARVRSSAVVALLRFCFWAGDWADERTAVDDVHLPAFVIFFTYI